MLWLTEKSEKLETRRANCDILLKLCWASTRGGLFGLCAGLCSHAHTSLVWTIIVPHSKKNPKHSSTIPQEQDPSKYNRKLSTSALLFLVCLITAASGLNARVLEIKSDNNLQQSLHFFLCSQIWYWGSEREKMVKGWWKQRGGAEEATISLLMRLFSLRKGQFSPCERLRSSEFFSSACGSSVNVQHCATGCGI